MIARLKIEIAVIEAALGQLTKNGKQVLMIQAICRQYCSLTVFRLIVMLLVCCRLTGGNTEGYLLRLRQFPAIVKSLLLLLRAGAALH